MNANVVANAEGLSSLKFWEEHRVVVMVHPEVDEVMTLPGPGFRVMLAPSVEAVEAALTRGATFRDTVVRDGFEIRRAQ